MIIKLFIFRLKQLLIFPGLVALTVSCGYLQLNPPPDVQASEEATDQSGWLAAASNMLAAAGYGYGQDVQGRADNIYRQMTAHFGTHEAGWTDAALQWWIGSKHNEWPNNPYKLVLVIGNKEPPVPWTHPEGAALIGSLLRQGHFVSASISWPDPNDPDKGVGGHVLNCWGDDMGEKKDQDRLPGHLRVTDAYRNKGGIIQTYPYTEFSVEGQDGKRRQGWHIDYDANNPYIKNLVLLSKVDDPGSCTTALLKRTALSLKNSADKRIEKAIVNYSQETQGCKTGGRLILENGKDIAGMVVPANNGGNEFAYEWNLNRNGVESGQLFTFEMESAGKWDSWSGLNSGMLVDRQGTDSVRLPEFSWKMSGSGISTRYSSTSYTGGYYILRLLIATPDTSEATYPNGYEVTLLVQYPTVINPERPVFYFTAPEGYVLKTVKAGHQYGLPDLQQALAFSSWMANMDTGHPFSGDTLSLPLNMIGLLPYPEGDNYQKRIIAWP